jgi:hypothetical protein
MVGSMGEGCQQQQVLLSQSIPAVVDDWLAL